MTEEVKNKLKELYDSVTERATAVIGVFRDQFTAELVDDTLPTFQEFIDYLQNQTLGSMGITSFTGNNEYGSYTIDREDYELNGKGKPLLDYIPDLGLLDYLRGNLLTELYHLLEIKNPDNRISITIRFPKVKVTNEYDKSIDISELYVRVKVNLLGQTSGRFTMTRAEYTMAQWASDYAHSHLSGIDVYHPGAFREPCTGTGPINQTISTLRYRYDLNIWGLYAFELSKFVTVESIAGTPYRRLEGVRNQSNEDTHALTYCPIRPSYSSYDVTDFIKEFLSTEPVRVSYCGGSYTLGENYTDFRIRISNAFIKWHNARVLEEGRVTLRSLIDSMLISKYIVAEGKVYPLTNSRFTKIQDYEGRELFMFKGRMVRLHFMELSENLNVTYLLATDLCDYIICKILEIVSYNYGRTEENEGSTGDNPSSGKCYYA